MEMSPEACWDCPVSLSAIAAQLGLLLCFALLGAALQRFRPQILRSIGWVLIVFAFGLAALVTRYVPYWGIFRPGSSAALFSRPAAYVIMGGVDLVLVAVTVVVYRKSVRRRMLL